MSDVLYWLLVLYVTAGLFMSMVHMRYMYYAFLNDDSEESWSKARVSLKEYQQARGEWLTLMTATNKVPNKAAIALVLLLVSVGTLFIASVVTLINMILWPVTLHAEYERWDRYQYAKRPRKKKKTGTCN